MQSGERGLDALALFLGDQARQNFHETGVPGAGRMYCQR